MTPLTSLAVPVLVSAVIVFVASSIIHMVLTYHRADFKKMPREDEALEALRRLETPPGDYMAPHAGSPAGMKEPAFVEKLNKGPWVVLTLAPGGAPGMGGALALWFLYSVMVGLFSGYLASRVLGPGAHYLAVFRIVGTAAFMGYSLALLQNSIWYKRDWGATLRSVFDGLVYSLLTAGAFGWLWPR